MAKITLPDGAIFEGTVAEIHNFVNRDEKLKGGYHYSRNRNAFVHVTHMNTIHLRNVLNQRYEEWLKTVKSKSTAIEIINTLNAFDPFTDPEVELIVGELVARAKRGL